VTHDAGRPPGHGPDRHAIGITRTCLASGTLQLPFALAGVLPEGELLVHDTESDEPLVLWSDPPRRLAGLAPFFERHELQVNDSVVLEVRGDELRLATAKRPRRARPAVRPSTWHSLREERPEPDPTTAADDADPDAHGRPAGAEEARPDRRPQAPAPPRVHDAAPTAWVDPDPREDAPGEAIPRDATPIGDPTDAADAWARPTDPSPEPDDGDDDAPRAPRVAVRPLGEADVGTGAPPGRPVRASEARALRPGPWARLGRLARSLFGAGGDAPSERDEAARRARERDWTRAWDEEEPDEELAPTPEFVDEPPAPAKARVDADRAIRADPGLDPDPARDDALDDGLDEGLDDGLDEALDDAFVAPDARADDLPPAGTEAPGAVLEREFEGELDEEPASEPEEVPRDGPSARREDPRDDLAPDRVASEPPGATPLFPDEVARARPRRPVDETPSGVPARAERFLGGDLRTRLLRYLESPEMGSIAQAERIAKRFDLDVETATEMLADIADEPPDGLRLRPTREGAWRIERTLRR
jgi:hypothetical protein